MIERQVIVTWYTPDEKKPPKGDIVLVTVSGRRGRYISYDHAFALASWYDDGDGFLLEDGHIDDFVIHAWADIEPYGVKEATS